MKQNDWIVASLNNPTFDAGDFQYISDMTLDNTQLLSKDQYLKSKFIRGNDRFKTSSGEFSEDLFNQFYDNAASEFARFSTENIVDNYEYNMWDVMRPKNGKIKDINFNIGKIDNPEHMTIGVAGFNELASSGKSRRELAQDSKIWDPETQQYLDKSVNDLSLFENPIDYFKSLFDDPLVYATYDNDEYDDNGKLVHQKGEWKVNEYGEYYTEKLNGRSLLGKQVVSAEDYLTSENSFINKYDFFDSDDVQKSVGGVIAKNVAAVIPMLIPYVNKAYAGLLVGRELGKSLPMLYGMAMSFSGSDNVDSKLANTIAAYGQKFTGSTSDYAQENTFSFENFGNLMSDVALQWGQQKFIASTFSKLTGGGKRAINTAYAKAQNEYENKALKGINDLYDGKIEASKLAQYIGTNNPLEIKDLISKGGWMETAFGKAAINKYLPAAQKIAESRMKMGQDLSLVYMAIISNTDVYDSVLQKGGTPREAAAIALGSTIGMFAVDKYLGLGEMFFNEEPARIAIRQAARHNADLLMGSAGIRQAEAQTRKGILGFIQKGIGVGKKAVSDYQSAIKDRSLGFVGKSLGEGLEEVSEELVADLSKQIGELAGQFGYFSQTDYGAWENAFDRYAMSFLGGAAGGGLFYGIDAVQNRNNKTNEFQNELTYLLRQGKKNEIFAELDKLRKNGKLGSKELSYNTTTDETGKTVYLTANNEEDSQSTYVYNTLKKTINQLDMILNDNQLNVSDDELFDRMVQGEYRANALSDFLKGTNKENMKEISYITRYQQDFQKLANDILNVESKIQELINTTSDPSKRNNPEFQEKLDNLKKEKEELIKQRDYLFGEGSLGYVEKMLFAMDTKLSGQFVSLNYDQFVRNKTGKSVSQLTAQEKETYKKQFDEYSKTKKMSLDKAFKLFKEMQGQINPEIQKLSEQDLKVAMEQFSKAAELDPFGRYLNYDSKLEGESEEDYRDRYSEREGETKEQFQKRFQDRFQKIQKYNSDNIYKWINELTKVPIDRSSFRQLQSKIGILRKTVFNNFVEGLTFENNIEFQKKIWNILKTVDIENKEELYNQIRKAVRENIKSYLEDQYDDRLNLNQWDSIRLDLEGITGDSYDAPLTKKDIWDWINSWIDYQKSQGNISIDINDVIQNLITKEWNFNILDSSLQINKDTIDKINKEITEQKKKWLKDIKEDLTEDQKQALLDKQLPNVPENITSVKDLETWLIGNYSKTHKNIFKKYGINIDEAAVVNNQIIDFYNRVASGLTSITSEEADEVVEINDDYFKIITDEQTDIQFDDLKKLLENDLFKQMENSEQLKALTNLEKISFINNPLLSVVKQISKKFRDIDIEDILENIYQQYTRGESAKDFQLTDPQLQSLKQIKEDLEMAKAFIYAASTKSGYSNPIGHNKSINEFAANHKDVFGKVESLPEIDEETANFLINEANIYESEIDSWLGLHQRNTADKVKKFTEADVAFNKTRLEFYKVNKDAFKINPTLDLLDGYESISLDESLSSLVQIEELLHRNFKKAVKNGTTLEQILDAILSKIVNLENLKTQKISKLDENIAYPKLTDYDKFAILISNFALSSADFYTKLKQFITDNKNIAPLSIQEYAAKISQAQQSNPEIINGTLKYLAAKFNLPYLENTTVITGVGGGGKTQAVAKLSVSNGQNTWLSGPTQSQIDGLLTALPKGKGISKQALFETILGKDAAVEFLNAVKYDSAKNKWTDATNGKYFTVKRKGGLDDNTTVVLKKSVKVNKVDNAPKYLVIDEATHFNTAELQLIGKFAKENNINVILLGDNSQNGFAAPGLMLNFDREAVLAWRAPKLFISLRDNNVQKVHNLQSILNIMDQIQETSGEDELVMLTKKLLEGDFKQLAFKYYNKDKFFGELITKDISQELISKLDSQIGFIGTSESPFYKQLKDAGKDVVLIDPLKVQGREFDYVIVDREWKFKPDYNKLGPAGAEMETFLRDLYTMISRSRKGTILIDNGLSSIVTNIEDQFTGESSSIKEAVQKFRETRLQQIEQALSTIQSEVEEKPEEKTDDKIKGTNLTIDDIKDEENPSVDNDADRQKEVDESRKDESKSYINMTTPTRVYTNVSYSGIDTTGNSWSNSTDSKTDLGIFLRSTDAPVQSGEDKYKLVRKLMELKSVLIYGLDYYDRLPNTTRRLIPRSAFDDIEYYVSVEDVSNSNRLVGLTDLSQDKRDIINGKIVTLKAKLKVRDDDGNVIDTFTVTLGGLANPKTWDDNSEDIKKAIQARIDNGDEKSAELQEYLDKLDDNILAYSNRIAEITKKNQEIRINAPEFSKLTTLIKRDKLRLENINLVEDKDDNGDPILRVSNYSPFDNETRYAVVSQVETIVKQTPGVSEAMIGKRPVIYVSNNILLNPDELSEMYRKQKEDPSLAPQVRAIMLDTEGVSFASLYRKSYQEMYTISNSNGKYSLPFESEPMAIRMYISIWNFRSNLQRFLQNYNTWLEDNKLEERDVENLCKLDNQLYYSIVQQKQEKLKETQEYKDADEETQNRMLSQVYVDEAEYRKSITDEQRDKLKIIWDFNDGLSDRVRQFRLGYNSSIGAYIRKLTNLKPGGFYEDVNNTLGIYINPSIARQYSDVLNALFDNIINKIIPTDQDPLVYIDNKLAKGWFELAHKNRTLSLNLYDDKGNVINSDLKLPSENTLAMLPTLLVEISKYINIRGYDIENFDIRLSKNPKSRYFLKVDDIELDWRSLTNALEGGQVETREIGVFNESTIGIRPYTIDNGVPIGIADKRIENMFNLMFHGMIPNAMQNDFNRGDIRATDAKFRFGFFADAIIAEKENDTNKTSVKVLTNRRLFSANVVPGFPIIGISLNPYVEEEIKPVESEKPIIQTDTQLEQIKSASIQTLSDSGITIVAKALSKVQSIEDLFDLVKSEINNKFTKYFEGQELSPLENLIIDVKINNGKLEFTYFPSSPKLKGQSIQSYEWRDKSLVITTSDGNKKSVQMLRGELQWSDITDPQPAQRTVGQVISDINEIMAEVTAVGESEELLSPEDYDIIKMNIQDSFKGNTDDTMASRDLILRAINSLQELLEQTFKDESNAKWTLALENANKRLTAIKNSCVL